MCTQSFSCPPSRCSIDTASSTCTASGVEEERGKRRRRKRGEDEEGREGKEREEEEGEEREMEGEEGEKEREEKRRGTNEACRKIDKDGFD